MRLVSACRPIHESTESIGQIPSQYAYQYLSWHAKPAWEGRESLVGLHDVRYDAFLLRTYHPFVVPHQSNLKKTWNLSICFRNTLERVHPLHSVTSESEVWSTANKQFESPKSKTDTLEISSLPPLLTFLRCAVYLGQKLGLREMKNRFTSCRPRPIWKELTLLQSLDDLNPLRV